MKNYYLLLLLIPKGMRKITRLERLSSFPSLKATFSHLSRDTFNESSNNNTHNHIRDMNRMEIV